MTLLAHIHSVTFSTFGPPCNSTFDQSTSCPNSGQNGCCTLTYANAVKPWNFNQFGLNLYCIVENLKSGPNGMSATAQIRSGWVRLRLNVLTYDIFSANARRFKIWSGHDEAAVFLSDGRKAQVNLIVEGMIDVFYIVLRPADGVVIGSARPAIQQTILDPRSRPPSKESLVGLRHRWYTRHRPYRCHTFVEKTSLPLPLWDCARNSTNRHLETTTQATGIQKRQDVRCESLN